MQLVAYRLNSVDGHMYHITLFFSDKSDYSVTVNFPEVTDEVSLGVAIKSFAQQHIDGMQPHPLSNVVGKTINAQES